MNLFIEFTTIVLLATLLSLILRLLKQPLVIGYILTGIFIGPHFFNIVHSTTVIDLFSQIGITILLFIVGLNLSPNVIKEVGKVSFIGGLGQIILTTLLGFIISKLLGMSYLHAFYVGLALSFSSTVIILKLLFDKGDLPKLYGKITVGILLIQDLVAIFALLFITSLAAAHGNNFLQTISFLTIKFAAIAFLVYLVSRYLIMHAIHYLAESQELLFLFSIAWGLGLSTVFYVAGFSTEIGALIAGVSLSVTPFADGIASRLKPLRDFFIILFFIFLGSNMIISTIPQILFATIALSLFVLIIKPLIVFILMNLLGYKTKQGFQTSISLAQISEFSLILVSLGLSVGELDKQTVSLITLSALITIAASSYFILYSDTIYSYLESLLKKLEIIHSSKTIQNKTQRYEIVLFGFDRVGRDFIEAFDKLGKKYLVVDYNPEMIEQLEESEIPFKYGDVEDVEFLQDLQLGKVKLCVSTIPNVKVNALVIKKIREINKNAIIIVRAGEIHEAKQLYALGATYVLMPHYLGAKYATSMIKRIGFDVKGFDDEREKHLTYVNKT